MQYLLLFISLCSATFFGNDIPGCPGCSKLLAIIGNNTVPFVQTTSPTFFKQRFQDFRLNFTEWEIRANNFFVGTYGSDLDFSSVAPIGSDDYGQPYKENDAALLYLLTFNDGHLPNGTYIENILGQNVVMASGFVGDSYITRGIQGNVVYGRAYNFQIIFKTSYLASKNMTGIFGSTLQSLGESFDKTWVTTFYGYSRYTYSGLPFIFDKSFVICAPQPSIRNFQFNANFIRIINRLILIDLETDTSKSWNIGDASIDELQYPAFVPTPDIPINYNSGIFMRFPSLYRNGVTDKSCIPSTYF